MHLKGEKDKTGKLIPYLCFNTFLSDVSTGVVNKNTFILGYFTLSDAFCKVLDT